MAFEKIDFDFIVEKNVIKIIPKTPIKDNSSYEFKFTNIKNANTLERVELENVNMFTRLTPLYCNAIDVESLLDVVEIEEKIILYNIREASKFAEYVFEKVGGGQKLDEENVPFAVKEFVRYRSAKDCLLKLYLSIATNKMTEGMLGEVKFKIKEQVPDLKKIIDYLDKEANTWLNSIRGYEFEGRAKMQTAIRASKFKKTGIASSSSMPDINLNLGNRGSYGQ